MTSIGLGLGLARLGGAKFNAVIGPDNPTWGAALSVTGSPTARSNQLQGGQYGLIWDATLYCPGGFVADGSTIHDGFNITTNTWTSLQAVPTALYGSALCRLEVGGQKRIYAIGGRTNASLAIRTNRYYRPDNNTWTAAADVSDNLCNAAIATDPDNEIIYVMTGTFSAGSNEVLCRIFNAATNSWDNTTIDVHPVGVAFAGAGFWDGKIYVFGGSTNLLAANYVTTMRRFDLATDDWTTLSGANQPLPAASGHMGVVQKGQYIYVFGHVTTAGALATSCWRFDCEAETWATLNSLGTARIGAFVGSDGTDYWAAMGGASTNVYKGTS